MPDTDTRRGAEGLEPLSDEQLTALDELMTGYADDDFFVSGSYAELNPVVVRFLIAEVRASRRVPSGGVDIEAIKKAAYQDGWNDRESDLLVGLDRLGACTAPSPGAVTVDEIAQICRDHLVGKARSYAIADALFSRLQSAREGDDGINSFKIGSFVQPRGGGEVCGKILAFNADQTGALVQWNDGHEIWKNLKNLEVLAPSPRPGEDERLQEAAKAVVEAHDEWASATGFGAPDDPLSDEIEKLRVALRPATQGE